jgi:hypothetical protein
MRLYFAYLELNCWFAVCPGSPFDRPRSEDEEPPRARAFRAQYAAYSTLATPLSEFAFDASAQPALCLRVLFENRVRCWVAAIVAVALRGGEIALRTLAKMSDS